MGGALGDVHASGLGGFPVVLSVGFNGCRISRVACACADSCCGACGLWTAWREVGFPAGWRHGVLEFLYVSVWYADLLIGSYMDKFFGDRVEVLWQTCAVSSFN